MTRLLLALPVLAMVAGCATRGDITVSAEEQRAIERQQYEANLAMTRELAKRALPPEPAAKVGDLPRCDVGVAMFVDEAQVRLGSRPTRGCAYNLAGMMAFQRVPGGYMIADPIADGHVAGQRFALFETQASFAPRDVIGGFAVYVGTRSYTAVDGFTREVFAFRAYP